MVEPLPALRVLFVNAVDTRREVQTKFPPLGIGYLVSSLRERFGKDQFEFKVINGDVEQEIQAFRPDVVGISSVSQNYDKAIAYAAIAKAHGRWVLCGGVHISMLPGSLSPDMDVGVIGEGERTICDLFSLFLSKGAFDPEDLKAIRGITYHDNGQIIVTGEREPIQDLDTIPPPARDLFPAQAETYMFTSRGCPFRCTFCASSRFWKGPVRKFSAERIVSEMEYLVNERGVTNICLYDDIFPFDERRVLECQTGLSQADLIGNIRFTCSVRANLVTPNAMAILREMGVTGVGVGMESGCQRTLDYLKGTTVQDNIDAIRTIRKAGLKVHASFIIGSPDETMKEALDTIAFIKEHRLSASLYLLTPFPGTPIWSHALERGLVSNDMDWSELDVEYAEGNRPVVVSERLTEADIHSLFARFESLRRKRRIFDLAKDGVRHPRKVPSFLWRKMAAQEVR